MRLLEAGAPASGHSSEIVTLIMSIMEYDITLSRCFSS
jgi:hypothetical protein